ncbi:MAG: diguanylate cyclase [Desulfobacterales bacterium]|nr:diguanylate cyclase [Desulfobacterales bacterium]
MIKVAVIEDSKVLASLYRSYLENSHFSASVFGSSPGEIQRLLETSDFQVVICPCFPKHQEGPAIARSLKADPQLNSAILILSTSLQRERIPSEWDPGEIDTILLKPFDRNSLTNTLNRAYFSHGLQLRKTPKALVIDDSRAIRNTLENHLGDLGYKVETAPDGMAGLTLARSGLPDLIFVDVEMPVMDGFEFCRALSQDPQLKHTPVIVISGTINESQFRKGFSAGAVDFLEKPISQENLAEIIDSVSITGETRSVGTTVILSRDATLCAILNKTLNFLHSRIRVYERLDELETYLNIGKPDIIVLDLSGYEDKLATCMRVRNAVGNEFVVIIAVAGESDRDLMFQCFKYGATEFLIKPFGRDEVKARIQNHIKLKALQDELLRKNKILESLAYKDKLTGLMNRRYFDKALTDEIQKAKTRNTSLSFLMLDLDNFKHINDQYGHDIGDEVLEGIAAVLMENAPDNAVPCRYGGEEFCIIYPETPLEDALKVSEKICRFCSAGPISRHRIFQTVSGGLASFPETSSAETLVMDADHCLYQAKNSGKNRIIARPGVSTL